MELCYLFHYLLQVQTCKKDLRLVRYLCTGRIETEGIQFLKLSVLCVQLLQDTLCGLRHKGFQQGCTDADALYQIVEYSSQTVFLCFILCQCPWHSFINIFVQALEEGKYFSHSISYTKLLHLCLYLFRDSQYKGFHVFVYFLCYTLILHNTTEVFVGHGNRTVYKVSKSICKLRVETLYHQLPGDHTIILKWHFMKHKVADCIYTKEIYQFICIKYISFGFTHFAVTLEQPWMTKYLFRQRQIQ